MIGLTANDDHEVVFELFGESGERKEFVYDSEPALHEANQMMQSGLDVLRSLQEVGFDQTMANFGLNEDVNPDPDGKPLDSPEDFE
jgi:hypothetical protein